MSIYGAMFSGVSGLNANSQALGAIADNITNVNTIGYKSTEVRFQTLVTAQAGLNNYSPGGVQQRPFSAVDVQGLFQSSTNATDLGISGDGFFTVNQNSSHDGATGFRFTRAGAFNADKSGYLRNTAGYYLQGYRTNSLGQTVDSNNNSFNPDPTVFTNLQTIRLNNIGGTASATQKLTFGANLPAEAAVGDTNNTTIQVYDSLGVAQNLQLVWTKVNNNQWDLSVSPPSGGASAVLSDSSSNVYASTGRLDFDSAPVDGDTISFTFGTATTTFEFDSNAGTTSGGTAVTFTSGSATSAANALTAALNAADPAATLAGTASHRFSSQSGGRINISQVVTTTTDANAGDITFNASGTSELAQYGAGAVTITKLDLDPSTTAAVVFDGSGIPTSFNVDSVTIDLNNGAADLDINLDLGTVGQADGIVQFAAAYNPTFIDTDGSAFGQFSGVTISTTGLVTALFENGDVRPIYKVPVATFANPDGLGINSGNVYNQTDFSGLFFLRTAGTGGAGTVQSSVLESSTVDIAKEFTNMITTQRAYSASAKIISTADQMLDELVNIKR